MVSFWHDSWEKIDSKRIAEYVEHFDLKADDIIDYLHVQNVKKVCDAGCGCGIYALKLASHGFCVSGFDISADAVKIAQSLFENTHFSAQWKTASILSTGYPSDCFDGVVSRDVIDHMTKSEAKKAVLELYRIAVPGGCIVITLDPLDAEYETEPHWVNGDGDFLFTEGKWKGMVFHPYGEEEIGELIPPGAISQLEKGNEFILKLQKPA